MRELLRRSPVPLAAVHSEAVLGGTAYRLEIEDGDTRVIVSWSHELPHAWKALGPVVDFLSDLASPTAHEPAASLEPEMPEQP